MSIVNQKMSSSCTVICVHRTAIVFLLTFVYVRWETCVTMASCTLNVTEHFSEAKINKSCSGYLGERTEFTRNDMIELFNDWDLNGDNITEFEEFLAWEASQVGVDSIKTVKSEKDWFEEYDFDKDGAYSLDDALSGFDMADSSKDGTVSYTECFQFELKKFHDALKRAGNCT